MITSNLVIMLIVICFALYLVYNQKNESSNMHLYKHMEKISMLENKLKEQEKMPELRTQYDGPRPYVDPIKDDDYARLIDPLTYPQMRLSRDVLDRYNEYYEKTGTYPPFGLNTKPYLQDTPILNGLLQKIDSPMEPFNQDVPKTIPLFRQTSQKNNNRYYYYILDQTHFSRVELKIPFDVITVNGKKYLNANYYGIPELFDEDIVEGISMYRDAKFKVILYKTYGPN